jgi:hypothetical protein
MTFLLCCGCIYLFLGCLVLTVTARDMVRDHWKDSKPMILAGAVFMLLFGPTIMALFMGVELYATFVWLKGNYSEKKGEGE